MLKHLLAASAVSLAITSIAEAQDFRSPSAAGTKLYFIAPKNGASVKGPVLVKMGLSGMGIAPAGMEKKDTGHHHILVDQKLADMAAPLPQDDKHRHFGGGQTETTLTLPPGKHTLQLVLGDHNHIPHNPPILSEVITITVKK